MSTFYSAEGYCKCGLSSMCLVSMVQKTLVDVSSFHGADSPLFSILSMSTFYGAEGYCRTITSGFPRPEGLPRSP